MNQAHWFLCFANFKVRTLHQNLHFHSSLSWQKVLAPSVPGLPRQRGPLKGVISAVRWGLKGRPRRGGPPKHIFVTRRVCPQSLQWTHSSQLTGHPGITGRNSIFPPAQVLVAYRWSCSTHHTLLWIFPQHKKQPSSSWTMYFIQCGFPWDIVSDQGLFTSSSCGPTMPFIWVSPANVWLKV